MIDSIIHHDIGTLYFFLAFVIFILTGLLVGFLFSTKMGLTENQGFIMFALVKFLFFMNLMFRLFFMIDSIIHQDIGTLYFFLAFVIVLLTVLLLSFLFITKMG